MTVPYKTKSGLTQYKPSLDWITKQIERSTNVGFCLACGTPRPGTEPDARQYECPKCHKPKAYGAEELLLMGLYHDGPAPRKIITPPQHPKYKAMGATTAAGKDPADVLKLHPDFYPK